MIISCYKLFGVKNVLSFFNILIIMYKNLYYGTFITGPAFYHGRIDEISVLVCGIIRKSIVELIVTIV